MTIRAVLKLYDNMTILTISVDVLSSVLLTIYITDYNNIDNTDDNTSTIIVSIVILSYSYNTVTISNNSVLLYCYHCTIGSCIVIPQLQYSAQYCCLYCNNTGAPSARLNPLQALLLLIIADASV